MIVFALVLSLVNSKRSFCLGPHPNFFHAHPWFRHHAVYPAFVPEWNPSQYPMA